MTTVLWIVCLAVLAAIVYTIVKTVKEERSRNAERDAAQARQRDERLEREAMVARQEARDERVRARYAAEPARVDKGIDIDAIAATRSGVT